VYKFPLTAFRLDLTIVHQAECQLAAPRTECDILWDSISYDQLKDCIIPRIDFCDEDLRNAISSASLDCIIDNNMLNFYEQDPLDLGNVSGAFVLDWNTDYSWRQGTLTGNITSFSYTNFPANKNVNFRLLFEQDGVGGHTINWAGSGVYFASGLTSTDMQPKADANSTTTYAIEWQDSKLFIAKVEYSDPQ